MRSMAMRAMMIRSARVPLKVKIPKEVLKEKEAD